MTMARSRSPFSRKTVAIAVAAAIGAGAVPAVGATGPLATITPQAVAQAQSAEPAISESALKYVGIFDGNGEKVTGLIDKRGTGVAVEDGWVMRINLDMAEVDPGDKITMFLAANTNGRSGGGFIVPKLDRTIQFDGVDSIQIKNTLNKYNDDSIAAQGVTLTGLDGAAGAASGVITINVPVYIPATYSAKGDGSEPGITPRENQPVSHWTRTYDSKGAKLTDGRIIADPNLRMSWNQGIPNDTSDYYQTWVSSKDVADSDGVELGMQVNFPNVHPNGTASVTYRTNEDLSSWSFTTDDNWVVRPGKVWHADPEKDEAITDEQRQAYADKVSYTAKRNADGTMTVTATGLPDGFRSAVYIRNVGYTDTSSPAQYGVKVVERTSEDETRVSGSRAAVPGAIVVDGAGNIVPATRVPAAEIRVNNRVTTSDTPVTVAPGQGQTFQLVLSNKGNTPLSRPNVTDPSGKVTTLTDVSIAPGESKTVDVKYTPKAGDDSATWVVQYSNADPVDATAWIKTGPAAGDVTVNDDGSVTIQTPDGPITLAPIDDVNEAKEEAERAKKEAEEANAKADDLQKQLDDEKAKNDADRQKIADLEKDLAQAKKDAEAAAKRAEDAAKKAQSEVDALEKVVSDLKADQAADREKIAGLEKQLQDAKDGLKRAQDAAHAAQNAATAAQNTANQALADLAKERERIDGLTEALDTERARVDDLTKRTDKAEKDLADARKRVANLEKQNDKQQEQIDAAAAKIVKLTAETQRLNKELEAAKKRVAALEKQNAEQEKQLAALAEHNAKQDKEIARLTKENKDQAKQIKDLRTDLDATKQRVTTLEDELAATQAELKDALERLGVVEDRLNTGIGKCVGTIGGSLMALVPAVLLASQVTGGMKIPAVDEAFAEMQRQIGAFNPQLARAVDENRGALAAGFAGLGLIALLMLPNTCGDASIGGAVAEPLSSEIDRRKQADKPAENETDKPAEELVAAQ